MQRLEVSEQDNGKLKQEVVELKAELQESRDQLSQVWREVTDKLASLARPRKRRGPFMLTEDMRVVEGRDTITNLFVD